MGKLYAIADIHVSYKFNLEAFTQFLTSLPSRPTDKSSGQDDDDTTLPKPDFSHSLYDFREDGLILAGDISEKLEHLRLCFDLAVRKFKTVWWVPGNHELYTLPGTTTSVTSPSHIPGDESDTDSELTHSLRGEAKYLECCRIATEYGVLTPEDEYIRWDYQTPQKPVKKSLKTMYDNVDGNVEAMRPMTPYLTTQSVLVCPVFTLYDYSMRPSHVSREQALDWAMEEGVQATDEVLLLPDPYPTRDEWCSALIEKTEARLQDAQSRGLPLVLINHWPLREDLISIPNIPRFTLWCGTKRTKEWHTKYNAQVVVTGHLHVRRTDWRDGVRFEEVSLGYPKQWEGVRTIGRGIGDVLREILPGQYDDQRDTIWRRNG